MTRLILIRHGETDYNMEKKYCGFSDPPLNKNGIWQCERLSNGLSGLKIDKVCSSDLKRAFQSADIIFKKFPIEQLKNFRELNFGVFDGLTYEVIIKKYQTYYVNWMSNPVSIKVPNGEGLMELNRRVKNGLHNILSNYEGKTVALVTHFGPVSLILCDALKLGLNMFWHIGQDLSALNIVDYYDHSEAKVVKLNDTSHLNKKEAP
jgi:broad specificity phosphatase PhoE